MIARPHCVLTGKTDLEPLHVFRRFPVYMGCTDRPAERDVFADMCWKISRGSGCLQLDPLLPLELLYQEQHNESVGAVWARHHREFAAFLARFQPPSVFEIGAAHGLLCRDYQQHHRDIDWTILEPNPHLVPQARARLLRGFFDDTFQFDGNIDAVVHSHVLEHMYEPGEFIGRLARFVPEGKWLIFSLPDMRTQLERGYTNCLNFEHTCYLAEPYVYYLLARHGFAVREKRRFEDHSLFYAAVREHGVRTPACPALYETNRALFLRFVSGQARLVDELNARLRAASGPVYLFGAHVFSQFLLANGLDEAKLAGVLDNGLAKIGKRLYGTRFTVASPQSLRGRGAVHVILRAGAYNDEIRTAIHKDINREVVFWE